MDSRPLHQPIETMDVSAHAVTRTRRWLRERATRGASDGERSHEVRSEPQTQHAGAAERVDHFTSLSMSRCRMVSTRRAVRRWSARCSTMATERWRPPVQPMATVR